MKRIIVVLVILFLLIILGLYLFSNDKGPKTSKEHKRLAAYNLAPELCDNDTLLVKSGFSVAFNKKHKIPDWAAYMLCKANAQHSIAERASKFKPEKCIKTACDKDYKSTGYDKGHIVPAKDMSYSKKCMNESFFYSNVAPQEPNFNRGRWKQLEEQVRNWAIINDSIYIVTGTYSKEIKNTIGKNNVVVPDFFFKVVFDCTYPELKGIAFIFPNEKTNEPIQKFVLTIDSLEKFTKMNFFSELPDNIEEEIESTSDIAKWGL